MLPGLGFSATNQEEQGARMALRVGQYYQTFVVELLMDERGTVRRTRVVHVPTGAEERWPGWDEMRLLQFVVSHAGLPS
jgi:hypothetical protein